MHMSYCLNIHFQDYPLEHRGRFLWMKRLTDMAARSPSLCIKALWNHHGPRVYVLVPFSGGCRYHKNLMVKLRSSSNIIESLSSHCPGQRCVQKWEDGRDMAVWVMETIVHFLFFIFGLSDRVYCFHFACWSRCFWWTFSSSLIQMRDSMLENRIICLWHFLSVLGNKRRSK